MNSAPWRLSVAALALLILGAALGVLVDRMLHRKPQVVGIHAMSPRGRMDALDTLLGLRPEQRQRIARIFAERQPAIDVAWREARGRIELTVDSVIAEIAAVLDSAQLVKYQALVQQVHGEERQTLPQR